MYNFLLLACIVSAGIIKVQVGGGHVRDETDSQGEIIIIESQVVEQHYRNFFFLILDHECAVMAI